MQFDEELLKFSTFLKIFEVDPTMDMMYSTLF